MSRGKADWNRAKGQVPYIDHEDWAAKLADNPESLYRLIADSYDVALREREAARGEQRSGRRPKPDLVPLEEVYEAVFPNRFSMEPFPVALDGLMDGESQRSFCKKVPCHQTTLSRLLAGTLEPDLSMMERLAAAAGVDPWFFREWRAGYVGLVVQRALMSDPSLSINAVRGLRGMHR